MFSKRGGRGLYHSPAETQVVARWARNAPIKAHTRATCVQDIEYSLGDIQAVLDVLLPDHASLASTLAAYTEGPEAVKAALSEMPASPSDEAHRVMIGVIGGVALQGVVERYGYDFIEDRDRLSRQLARLVEGLPADVVEDIAHCRRVFNDWLNGHDHMKWFFRDLVGRYKDALEEDESLASFGEALPWLTVSVGEPYYLAAAQCLPPCELRILSKYLFQESEQGVYDPVREPGVEELEQEIANIFEEE